nr:hypothetical protein CFP56_42203 [Quercus suber]
MISQGHYNAVWYLHQAPRYTARNNHNNTKCKPGATYCATVQDCPGSPETPRRTGLVSVAGRKSRLDHYYFNIALSLPPLFPFSSFFPLAFSLQRVHLAVDEAFRHHRIVFSQQISIVDHEHRIKEASDTELAAGRWCIESSARPRSSTTALLVVVHPGRVVVGGRQPEGFDLRRRCKFAFLWLTLPSLCSARTRIGPTSLAFPAFHNEATIIISIRPASTRLESPIRRMKS